MGALASWSVRNSLPLAAGGPANWPMGQNAAGLFTERPSRGHLVPASFAARDGAAGAVYSASAATFAFFNAVPAYQPFDGQVWTAFVERQIIALIDVDWAADPRAVRFYYIAGGHGAVLGHFCHDGVAVCIPAVPAAQTVPMRDQRWAVLIVDVPAGAAVAGGAAPPAARVAAVAFHCFQHAAGHAGLCNLVTVNALEVTLGFDPAPGLTAGARANAVFLTGAGRPANPLGP